MKWPQVLAAVALTGGLLAPFAGSPYRAAHAALDVSAVAEAVAAERDHVTAIELAEWIRSRTPGLRILDVGEGEYLLPGAEHVPIASLPAVAHTLRPIDRIVVYSSGGAHGAQAWVLMRALGFTDVYSLQGGVDAWLSEVMSPSISPTATRDERQAFEPVAELSRYFGGQPVVADPAPGGTAAGRLPGPPPTTASRIAAIRRRGC